MNTYTRPIQGSKSCDLPSAMSFANFYQLTRRCLTVLFIATASTANAQNATIIVGDTSGLVIRRNLYGQFAEHLGRGIYDGFYRSGKIRMDVVEALKKINIPVLRWPGGCFADQYHWKDGIGPVASRPKTVNTTWGMVTEDNSFGTAEFLTLCKLIGCQPYIAGNVGTGSPQEMKDWIEYLNFGGSSTLADLRKTNGQAEPYHVPYWGVGNESWGCGGLMPAETYATKYRTYALFCKNYPGSPLKKIAGGADADDYNWTETLMKNIPLWEMWGLSFHYYTRDDATNNPHSATQFDEADYFAFCKKALHMEELISKHGAIMDKYDPQKKVALVVDEWGIWVDTEPGTNPAFLYQQNSLRDALIAASTLNIFNNHCDRVKMANLAQTVNVIHSLILTKGDQMLLTPTYAVFDLYKAHHDAKLLPLKLASPNYTFKGDSIPAVNASASVTPDGIIHITLVNLDPKNEITVKTLSGHFANKRLNGKVLTSAKFTDYNTFDAPAKVAIRPFDQAHIVDNDLHITLPAKSVVELELKN